MESIKVELKIPKFEELKYRGNGFKRISDDIIELTKADYLNLLNQETQV